MQLSELSDLELTKLYDLFSNSTKREKDIVEHGYDLKFAYHVVRLLGEVEQILTEQDLDLTRDAERLKAIRRGEWTHDQIKEFFSAKEKDLEAVYNKSSLRYKADEDEIRILLLNCLEEHYGSIPVKVLTSAEKQIEKIKEFLNDNSNC